MKPAAKKTKPLKKKSKRVKKKVVRKKKVLRKKKVPRQKMVIGWREWVALPGLGSGPIKAKIDTGARSSALHAWNIEPFSHEGQLWVTFDIHPLQRNNRVVIPCQAPVKGQRKIRNSGGQTELRYIVTAELTIGERSWPIEISLTNRDEMGFRLLLGRTAVRRRVLIDVSKSFLAGAPGVSLSP